MGPAGATPGEGDLAFCHGAGEGRMGSCRKVRGGWLTIIPPFPHGSPDAFGEQTLGFCCAALPLLPALVSEGTGAYTAVIPGLQAGGEEGGGGGGGGEGSNIH